MTSTVAPIASPAGIDVKASLETIGSAELERQAGSLAFHLNGVNAV